MRKMAASLEAFNPSYAPERDRNRDAETSEFHAASGVAIAWIAFYAIAIVAGLLRAGVIG